MKNYKNYKNFALDLMDLLLCEAEDAPLARRDTEKFLTEVLQDAVSRAIDYWEELEYDEEMSYSSEEEFKIAKREALEFLKEYRKNKVVIKEEK